MFFIHFQKNIENISCLDTVVIQITIKRNKPIFFYLYLRGNLTSSTSRMKANRIKIQFLNPCGNEGNALQITLENSTWQTKYSCNI